MFPPWLSKREIYLSLWHACSPQEGFPQQFSFQLYFTNDNWVSQNIFDFKCISSDIEPPHANAELQVLCDLCFATLLLGIFPQSVLHAIFLILNKFQSNNAASNNCFYFFISLKQLWILPTIFSFKMDFNQASQVH